MSRNQGMKVDVNGLARSIKEAIGGPRQQELRFMVDEMARALMEGEAKEERLEAIVGPLNRLLEAGEHVRAYPANDGPDGHHVSIASSDSLSVSVWTSAGRTVIPPKRTNGYSAPTLADALDKACKALLGKEAT